MKLRSAEELWDEYYADMNRGSIPFKRIIKARDDEVRQAVWENAEKVIDPVLRNGSIKERIKAACLVKPDDTRERLAKALWNAIRVDLDREWEDISSLSQESWQGGIDAVLTEKRKIDAEATES